MPISQPSYPTTTSTLVTHVGSYTDTQAALRAAKPGSAADAFGTQFQFVTEKDGNTANDGLSWGSAKKEIQQAIAALPNGGTILVAPGTYRPTATLALSGHMIFCFGAPFGGLEVNKTVTIVHEFNGDLIDIQGGGGIAGAFLYQNGNFTGTAIKAVSTNAARTGNIYLRDLVISGTEGFTRDLDLDGSADSTAGGPGLRSVFIDSLQCFGCKTAGETVRLNRVLHASISGLHIVQAPEAAVTQGLKILHAESADILIDNFYCLGNVSSQAAGSDSVLLRGSVTGSVTWESGSANNQFAGHLGGAYSNLGATSNRVNPSELQGATPTVASAATVTLPENPVVKISGTTTITSITASWAGRRVTLIFTGALTLTDGGNLKLQGNFTSVADDAITLACDGTNWYEC